MCVPVEQVLGAKRWLLAPPAAYASMNVLPSSHPSSRQSALDWPHTNTTAFPAGTTAGLLEATLQVKGNAIGPTDMARSDHARLFFLWRTLSVRILTNEHGGSSTGSPHIYVHKNLHRQRFKEKINARGLGVAGH